MTNNYGSTWNKWDLHLHSCYTYLNNNFKHDNTGSVVEQTFVDAVVNSGLKAIGLTNYFKFCDEDFVLKKKLNELGVKTFLNLEIRLSHFNNSDQNYDYHIVFDDEIDDDIIKTFLANVEAEVGCGSKKLSQLSKDEINNSAVVHFNSLSQELEKESSGLQGKYLLGFLSRGHGSATTKGRSGVNYETVTRKSDFVLNSSDSQDNIITDRKFWLEGSPYKRPLLQGSDAHSLEKIGAKYSWIKSDITFNGLKQIVFEPEDRISLNKDYPDIKKDYQIIDKVIFEQEGQDGLFKKRMVYFNPNLNTVIGGRSNGKSTLTNSIAKTLGNPNFQGRNENIGSGMFTFKDISNTCVVWKDGQENKGEENLRDVEFLPQDHMIRIAENDELRNELIEETVKADNENYQMIVEFDEDVQSIQNKVGNLIREWQGLDYELSSLISPEGDKKGIEAELQKLKTLISEQQKNSNFSDQDNLAFETERTKLKVATERKKKAESDSRILEKISQESVEININVNDLSDDLTKQLQDFILNQQEQLNLEWQTKILQLQQEQQGLIETQNIEIKSVESSSEYEKGLENIATNETLRSLTKQAEVEEEKLAKFNMFSEETDRLNLKIIQKKEEILTQYNNFKRLREKLEKEFKIQANQVEIELNFLPITFESQIGYLHGRNSINNSFIEAFNENSDSKIESIFDNLDLSYNQGKTQNDLIKDVLERQWYSRNYTLKYDGDNFLQMSQGKKAFVILTLILEFSKDEKPVIIDQPEDSLDNRAIYVELTKYLKSKKRDRQIILVTHNPNVVVGADSENVIVANQHSELYPNANQIQFDYLNGPLENSLNNDDAIDFLSKRGIREHVVELLEGGNEAFKKREEKYELS
ncbi:TPA: DNA repair ATPase [Enterococcus faecalis]|nr:DNA repair ATPase [Enterococcus faecalis]